MQGAAATPRAHVADPEIVELNVGGVHYCTTRTTLEGRAVEPEGTMLSAMFSGRLASRLDRDGRVFIDRDGARFGYLLNYLRDGALTSGTRAPDLLYALREEAAFFGMARLVACLDEEFAQWDLQEDLESMPSLSQNSCVDAEGNASDAGTPPVFGFSGPPGSDGERYANYVRAAPEPLDFTFTLNADF
jgi:BTB/POZ domain